MCLQWKADECLYIIVFKPKGEKTQMDNVKKSFKVCVVFIME